MSNVIESIERRQMRLNIPQFKAGDTVRVHFQVIEGERRRLQVFEGVERPCRSGRRRPL